MLSECVQFAVEYIGVWAVTLSYCRASKLLTHLCYAWCMHMTESISLWYASILECMYVCILTLSVLSWIVQWEQHQVLHARNALQVNTAGTFTILLLALRLLQLICWSRSILLLLLIDVVCACACVQFAVKYIGVQAGTSHHCPASKLLTHLLVLCLMYAYDWILHNYLRTRYSNVCMCVSWLYVYYYE